MLLLSKAGRVEKNFGISRPKHNSLVRPIIVMIVTILGPSAINTINMVPQVKTPGA
jgi:hypothetical protein